MAKYPAYENGDILAVIDVETTGLIAGYHDLIQVCVLILESDFTPSESISPFYLNIKPVRPQNADKRALKVTGLTMDTLFQGVDSYEAADAFDDWVTGLGLGDRCRILPIAHNWTFDKGFIRDWLGVTAFDTYISHKYRDTMIMGNFLNDVADAQCENRPFRHLSLNHMCSRLSISVVGHHNALKDCIIEAKLYKRLISMIKRSEVIR